MSDFEIKRDEKWCSVYGRLDNTQFVNLEGVEILASFLRDRLERYGILNREKDKLKIKLVEEVIKNNLQ